MTKQIMQDIDNVKRIITSSCDLVTSLQAYITVSIEDFDRCFDEMLNKQVLTITIGEVTFDFGFTQNEKPTIGIRRKDNCVFVGLPYTALFAIKANPDKKGGFLAFLDVLKDVITLETANLLSDSEDIIKEVNESNENIYYNLEQTRLCYAAGMVSLFVNSTRLNRLLFYKYTKDRQQLLDFLNTKYKDAYIYNGMYKFLLGLKDEYYKETIDLLSKFI